MNLDDQTGIESAADVSQITALIGQYSDIGDVVIDVEMRVTMNPKEDAASFNQII